MSIHEHCWGVRAGDVGIQKKIVNVLLHPFFKNQGGLPNSILQLPNMDKNLTFYRGATIFAADVTYSRVAAIVAVHFIFWIAQI